MAKDKNSVLIYTDWISTFDKLNNEEAGKLVKHLFRYINDMHPVAPDRITELLFEPIKQTLKRDLIKWETERNDRSRAGKLGMKKRWIDNKNDNTDNTVITNDNTVITNDNTVIKNVTNITDSVSVSVSDKEEIFNFKKSLINLGIEEKIVSDWLKVRTKKKAVNSETAFNSIKNQIEKSGYSANDCIKKAVEKSWAGFEAEWMPKQLNHRYPFLTKEESFQVQISPNDHAVWLNEQKTSWQRTGKDDKGEYVLINREKQYLN